MSTSPEGSYLRVDCTACGTGFWGSRTAAALCRKCSTPTVETSIATRRANRLAMAASRAAHQRNSSQDDVQLMRTAIDGEAGLTQAHIDIIQSRDELTPQDLRLLSEHFQRQQRQSYDDDSVPTAVTHDISRIAGPLRTDLQGTGMEPAPGSQAGAAPTTATFRGGWRRTASGWRSGAPTLTGVEVERLPTPSSDDWSGETCSICLSDMERDSDVRALPRCNHTFHFECIKPWFTRCSACPLCREVEEN